MTSRAGWDRAAALVLFVAATVAMAWPLVRHAGRLSSAATRISTASLRCTSRGSQPLASALLRSSGEAGGIVNRRNVGMLMAIVGSALSAWWAVQQRGRSARRAARQTQDRGMVIFDNTPRASETDAIV